tara:strand:- start:328 stop:780 length:453 start_codon:yes stop_codon:yes gene_type:complete
MTAATLTADHYARTLDSIAETIEGLGVDGYRTSSSDRWKRATRETAPKGGTGHLDFWVAIGDALDMAKWSRNHITYELQVSFLHRFRARTDGKDQAAFQAAALDVAAALTFWAGPNQGRATPRRTQISAPDGSWVLVRVGFTLQMQVTYQ